MEFHSPALIISNLSRTTNWTDLYNTLELYGVYAQKIQITEFCEEAKYGAVYCGILWLLDVQSASSAYNKLKEQVNNGVLAEFLGTTGHLTIKWLRYSVRNHNRKWCGVVLRGLADSDTVDSIKSKLGSG